VVKATAGRRVCGVLDASAPPRLRSCEKIESHKNLASELVDYQWLHLPIFSQLLTTDVRLNEYALALPDTA
jgi:hypothetical protein